MIKLMFSNHKLITSITSKILTKSFNKYLSCKTAKIIIKDINTDDNGGDDLLIHINGDLHISKEELMNLLNNKLEES